MSAVAGGDLDGFEEIVLRHQAEAWRVAWRFTGDAAEAEDLVQEAFMRILDAAARYSPTASFRTYLFRILKRLCIDHARRLRPSIMDRLPETTDGAPSPSHQADLAERQVLIRSALDELLPGQRMAVVLRYFVGLSGAQMAEAMGRSVKSVERLLARARASLEPRLKSLL
jgi:RNA polymerase sigma-70 factor (ECF subfamily)